MVLTTFAVFGASASALTQGFKTRDSSLRPGMMASLSPQSSNGNLLVQAADSKSRARVVGIVTELGNDLLSIAPAGSTIYVAQTGTTKAYVSDVNGTIRKGDLLALSPLRGMLMKAGSSIDAVAVALQDFSALLPQSVNAQNADGSPMNAKLALMQTNLDVLQSQPSDQSRDWSFLQSLGREITGKQINELRVLAAMAIFSIMLVTEGVIIHGIVVSSINAVGRNPMAARLISKQSIRSTGYGVVIFLAFLAMISVVLLI